MIISKNIDNNNSFTLLRLVYIKITILNGVASLQLPVKYPKCPANLIGKTETLIWCIQWTCMQEASTSRQWHHLLCLPSDLLFHTLH